LLGSQFPQIFSATPRKLLLSLMLGEFEKTKLIDFIQKSVKM